MSVTWGISIFSVCRLFDRPLARLCTYARMTCETWRVTSGAGRSGEWSSYRRVLKSSGRCIRRHSPVHPLVTTTVKCCIARERGRVHRYVKAVVVNPQL